MYPVTFIIKFRTAEGDEVEAFRWCRDAASGIARAWREADKFGYKAVHVWAEGV